MIVNLPVHEFRKELVELVDYRIIRFGFDTFLRLLVGPLLPFTGTVSENSFRLCRNTRQSLPVLFYIEGTFSENEGKTEVNYSVTGNGPAILKSQVIETFETEMNMLQHSHKSRFKR